MPEDVKEIEFKKLNLSAEDILIVKVNTLNLTEDQAVKKLAEVSNDEFIRYIEEKGNKVIVSYSGVDLQILRKEIDDRVVAYVEVSSIENEGDKKQYLDYVNSQLSKSIGEDLICIPVVNGSPKLAIEKEKVNE